MPDHILSQLFARAPLLPNLQTLFVSQVPNEEWVSPPGDNDLQKLLLLFLNHSVTHFAGYCDDLAIDPTTISDLAPNLKDIRLGCSDTLPNPPRGMGPCSHKRKGASGKGVYSPETAENWAMTLSKPVVLKEFAYISRITVNGFFICDLSVLEGLARVPALTSFAVVNPQPDYWERLGTEEKLFHNLTDVGLYKTTPIVALSISRCAAMFRSVKNLSVNLTHDGSNAQIEECLEALTGMTDKRSNMNTISVDESPFPRHRTLSKASLWSNSASIALLSSLAPQKLHTRSRLHVLQYNPSPMTAFSSAGTQLTELSLQGVVLPIQMLSPLSVTYPELSFLRCKIDTGVRDPKELMFKVHFGEVEEATRLNRNQRIVLQFVFTTGIWDWSGPGMRSTVVSCKPDRVAK